MNLLINSFATEKLDNQIIGVLLPEVIKNYHRFNGDIQIGKGILINKKIEEFSARHPSMIACGERFDIMFKNSSMEIVEIFFDHLMAANWSKYSDVPLKKFSLDAHAFMINHKAEYPYNVKKFLKCIIDPEFFENYKSLQGTCTNIQMIARYFFSQIGVRAEKPLSDLWENYSFYQEHFFIYMEDFMEEVKQAEKNELCEVGVR